MAGSVNLATICKHMLLLFSHCSKSIGTLHYPTTKIQTIFCRCNIFGYFCETFITKGIQKLTLRQPEHTSSEKYKGVHSRTKL